MELKLAENLADLMQTSTLEIAELSNKTHKHVLRDLKASKIPAKECTYKDAMNREQKYYVLDKPQTHAFLLSYNQETRVKVFEKLTKKERAFEQTVQKMCEKAMLDNEELVSLKAENKILLAKDAENMEIIRRLKPNVSGANGGEIEKVTLHNTMMFAEMKQHLAEDMLAGAIKIANDAIEFERRVASSVSYAERQKIKDFKARHDALKPINPHCVTVYKHGAEVKRLHDIGVESNHNLGIRADINSKGKEHPVLKVHNDVLAEMLREYRELL